MNKQDILNLTGLTEKQFYKKYKTQEDFIRDYPHLEQTLSSFKAGGETNLSVYNKTNQLTPTGQNNSFYNNSQGMSPQQLMERGKQYGWRTDTAAHFQEDMYKHISKNNPNLMNDMVHKYGAAKAGLVDYNGVQSFAPDNMLGARSVAIFNEFQNTKPQQPKKSISYKPMTSPDYYKNDLGQTSNQKIYIPQFQGDWSERDKQEAMRNGVVPDNFGTGTSVLKGQPYYETTNDTTYKNPLMMKQQTSINKGSDPMNSVFAEGGETNKLLQEVAGALQKGVKPEQILQQLVKMGMSQEQAVKMIQSVASQLQGQQQDVESPQEDQSEQQEFSSGGGYIGMDGKKHPSKQGTFNSLTGAFFEEGGINTIGQVGPTTSRKRMQDGFVHYFNTDKNGVEKEVNPRNDDSVNWNGLDRHDKWDTGKTNFQQGVRGVSGVTNTLIDAGSIFANLYDRKNQQDEQNAYMQRMMNTQQSGPAAGKGDYDGDGNLHAPQNYANSYAGMQGMYYPQQGYAEGGLIEYSNENYSGKIPSVAEEDFPKANYPTFKTNVPFMDNFKTSNNVAEQIASVESGGNYKALPKDPKTGKLVSSAVGKYQFLWNQNKDWISNVTGVTTKEGFRNNPEAQEVAFKYWNDTVLTPNANKIKKQFHLNVPLDAIKMKIHFAGPTGAYQYYATGKETTDAFGTKTSSYGQFDEGGVVEMDDNQLQQFLAAGGQVQFV